MDVTRLVDFLSTYPLWVRFLFSVWVAVSAVLLLCLIFFRLEKAETAETATVRSDYRLEDRRTEEDRRPAPVRKGYIVDVATGSSLAAMLEAAFDNGVTNLQKEGFRA